MYTDDPVVIDIPNAGPREDAGLFEYWFIIRRNKGIVAIVAVLGAVVGLLLTLPSPRIYQARTTLEVQGYNNDFLNMGSVTPTRTDAGYDAVADIQTHVRILQSRTLLERVAGRLDTLVQIVRAKHAFLEQYAQWANISYACKVAGVPRQNIYEWQEHDADFSRAFKIAESAATERLEREAWRRAVDGSPYKRTSYWHGEPVGTDEKIEYSDQLLQLLLRARRPDVYREKVDVAVSQIVKSVAGIDPASVL